MRRIWLGLLCLCLLLTTACTPGLSERNTEDTAGTYQLYFREKELSTAMGRDALRTETFYLDNTQKWETDQLAEALLLALMNGPTDETLRSAIPSGTNLLSVRVKNGLAVVDVSAPYTTISGVGLTLSDFSIALTLTQLPEISEVRITVRGQELGYRDRQIFTMQDALLTSNEDVISKVPVTLYFLNESGNLTKEERVLDLYEGDTQVSAVVKALEEGPEDRNLFSVLPENFRLRSIWVEDGTCYLNLSSATLQTITDPNALRVMARVLEHSLCSLESVEEVRFLVDGETSTLYGTVPLPDA